MAVANTQVQFDALFGLFTILAIIVGVIVFSLMVFLIVKYRDRPSAREPSDTPVLGKLPESRGHARSVVITVSLSTIILVVLIIGSFVAVDNILTPPQRGCPECSMLVTGHQFYWQFTYPNNYSDVGTLIVPLGKNIVLNVTSADVFHDFGIIGFDIKTDAIPGRINVLWFNPSQTGNYTIQCFELCGAGHATMIAKLIVLPYPAFQSWYNSTRR